MAWAYVAQASFEAIPFFTERRIFPKAFVAWAIFPFVYFAIDNGATRTVLGSP